MTDHNSPMSRAIRDFIMESTEEQLRDALGDAKFEELASKGRAIAEAALAKPLGYIGATEMSLSPCTYDKHAVMNEDPVLDDIQFPVSELHVSRTFTLVLEDKSQIPDCTTDVDMSVAEAGKYLCRLFRAIPSNRMYSKAVFAIHQPDGKCGKKPSGPSFEE